MRPAVRTLVDVDSLRTAVEMLAARDQRLAELYGRNGLPPLWRRPLHFSTLVRFVLEQQVSLASALAAYRRLEDRLGEIEPDGLLSLGDGELKAIGFSRQKTGYVRALAADIESGGFDVAELEEMSDADARRRLLSLHGFGPWTADCVLLFCLGRADAWPSGDRALQVAIGSLQGVGPVLTYGEADEIAAAWVPLRAAAARLLWHDYLGGGDHVEPA